MKLYTEEQVLKAMNDYANTSSDLDYVMDVEMAIIEQLTPIELPSDEYIDEVFQPMTELHQYYKDGFINGAKWMKEQILNQNK
jgi:hypothetical protein